jgi:hypothetical protein
MHVACARTLTTDFEEKMPYRQWFAALAMAAMPFAVYAQQTQSSPDVTNPAAPTAPVRYESAFSTYQTSSEDESTPDTVWRSVNEEMGKLGGQVGQVKANADGVAEPAKGQATNAKADSKPDAEPSGKPADHSKHH